MIGSAEMEKGEKEEMRLINADEFDVILTVIPDGVDIESYIMGMEYILDKIDSLPTIEERSKYCFKK